MEKFSKYKKHGILKRSAYAVISICFWLLVWLIAAKAVNNELLLPSPLVVLNRIAELAKERSFYITVLASLLRIISGIAIAVVLGALLAVITEWAEPIKVIIQPVMTLIKATPVASFILLAYVWISRTMIPIFIVILIVMPIIWGNVSEGIRNFDPKIKEMLRLYKVPFFRRLTKFYVPSTAPYFRSALLSACGLGWKSGIAAEVLTVPALAIGKMLFESKQYLETVDLFAWTFTVIILSYAIEKLFSLATAGFGKNAEQARSTTERRNENDQGQ